MNTGSYSVRIGVSILIAGAMLGAVHGARALLDDTGFIPPDATTLKCESGAVSDVSALRACAEKCHIKAATAALASKTFDEEACEKTDPVKSCRAQYDAKTTKLTGCPSCLDTALLADEMEGGLDRGALFCAGSKPLGGDESGFVPPDAATLKCESGVASSISKLEQCVEKCHIKAAAAALAGKTFDDEACEKTEPTKSCRAQYDASLAKLVGCPSCLDAALLADEAESVLDHGRGALYCAGSTPF